MKPEIAARDIHQQQMTVGPQREHLLRRFSLLLVARLGKDLELRRVEGHVAERQAGRDSLSHAMKGQS